VDLKGFKKDAPVTLSILTGKQRVVDMFCGGFIVIKYNLHM
jgi:hypothetical protein